MSAEASPPARTVNLSSIVTAREAVQFDHYVESIHDQSNFYSLLIEEDCKIITEVAKKVFGHTTTTEICGSFRKRTNISCSDVDFYIDTSYPITKENQEKFVDALKPLFNDANVTLGRLAIHVSTNWVDIDVVCSNTVQYGVRPRPNQLIEQNLAVQYAVRGLKEWAAKNIQPKVKGYLIENMALRIHSVYHLTSPLLGKGGLQLFISVLQSMVDSKQIGKSIFGLEGGTGSVRKLRDSAKLTLHHFILSHPVRGGLHSVSEIALWIASARDCDMDTMGGKIFDWMINATGDVAIESICRSIYHRFAPSNEPGYILPPISYDNHAITNLKLSPFGVYLLDCFQQNEAQNSPQTTAGIRTTGDHSIEKDIDNFDTLLKCAKEGSRVAQRMIVTRMEWRKAENLLNEKRYKEAITSFALSLRMSCTDADPFFGIFSPDFSKYFHAIEIIRNSDKSNSEVYLVSAAVLAIQSNIHGAIDQLKQGLNINPNDAFGLVYACGLLYGNLGQWSTALIYFNRCLELEPNVAIFHYWKGISLKNSGSLSNYESTIPILSCFETFLRTAYREGRKYSQAYYEVAFLRLVQYRFKQTNALKQKLKSDIRLAKETEKFQLPYFPPLKCDTKTIVVAFDNNHGLDSLADSSEQQKLEANAFFQQKSFLEAARLYSQILENDPKNVKVLSNRSAAYYELGFYTAAIEDAKLAIEIDTAWIKGYFRVAKAYLGRNDPINAKRYVLQALSVREDTSLSQLLLDCDEMLQILQSEANVDIFRKPEDLTELPCWNKVKFKHNVKVIDPKGNGDYISVTDAIYNNRDNAAVSLVITPGIHFDQISLNYFESKICIQILGWNPNDSDHRSEIRGYISNEVAKYRFIHEPFELISVGSQFCTFEIEDVYLYQPVGHPYTHGGACICCYDNAHVIVKNCQARTPNSPCFSVSRNETSLVLDNCLIKDSSAGVVASRGSFVSITNCCFSNSLMVAIEVRDGSKVELHDCKFVRSHVQAISLYNNGLSIEVTNCKFQFCGKRPDCSVILVETGKAVIRGCQFLGNSGDGIIVQQSQQLTQTVPPIVFIQDCRIERSPIGIGFYYGSGMLINNTITCCSFLGMCVRNLIEGYKLAFRGNNFSNNGTEDSRDLVIEGRTMFNKCITLERTNLFASSPFVLSDAECQLGYMLLQAQLQNMGIH